MTYNDTSRRMVLAGAGLAMIAFPAYGGAPAHPAPGLEFAFAATVMIGPAEVPGATPAGKRVRIPITGGHFEGPTIKGKVLPGGADWQLIRADSSVVLEADYMIEADDGALIQVHNRGVASEQAGVAYLRTTPVFEAPIGAHDWLNKAVFVGTIDVLPGNTAVVISVFKVI